VEVVPGFIAGSVTSSDGQIQCYANANSAGGGNCTAIESLYDTVYLTANPASPYELSSWLNSGNGQVVGQNQYAVTILPGNTTVIAYFGGPIGVTLNASGGEGIIAASNSQRTTSSCGPNAMNCQFYGYQYGTVTLTPSPATSGDPGWSGCPSSCSGTRVCKFTVGSNPVNCTYTFSSGGSNSGGGGTTTGGGTITGGGGGGNVIIR